MKTAWEEELVPTILRRTTAMFPAVKAAPHADAPAIAKQHTAASKWPPRDGHRSGVWGWCEHLRCRGNRSASRFKQASTAWMVFIACSELGMRGAMRVQ